MSEKDQVYFSILNAALQLDFKKGHQKWTLSELSRSSGITRSLIYYYFGKSREDILDEAIVLIGEEVFALNPQRKPLWLKREIAESILASRRILEASPHLIAFYFAHRTRPSRVGESIRKLEANHKKKLHEVFPHLNETEISSLFGIVLGLALAPGLSEPAIRHVVSIILDRQKTSETRNESPPNERRFKTSVRG